MNQTRNSKWNEIILNIHLTVLELHIQLIHKFKLKGDTSCALSCTRAVGWRRAFKRVSRGILIPTSHPSFSCTLSQKIMGWTMIEDFHPTGIWSRVELEKLQKVRGIKVSNLDILHQFQKGSGRERGLPGNYPRVPWPRLHQCQTPGALLSSVCWVSPSAATQFVRSGKALTHHDCVTLVAITTRWQSGKQEIAFQFLFFLNLSSLGLCVSIVWNSDCCRVSSNYHYHPSVTQHEPCVIEAFYIIALSREVEASSRHDRIEKKKHTWKPDSWAALTLRLL